MLLRIQGRQLLKVQDLTKYGILTQSSYLVYNTINLLYLLKVFLVVLLECFMQISCFWCHKF